MSDIKVIEFGDTIYAAYKESNGFQSGGYEGPLHFSSKNDNVVDPLNRDKQGRVYFLDKGMANKFKKNFDKAKKEYRKKASSTTDTRCEIFDLKADKPRTYKNVFNGSVNLSLQKRHTKYGDAYEIID